MEQKNKVIKAYVSGAFNLEKRKYAYGLIIVDGKDVKRFSDNTTQEEMLPMEAIAGEMIGAMKAMEYALVNHIPNLELHYKTDGIRKWTIEKNEPKTEYIASYKYFYNVISQKVTIRFMPAFEDHGANKHMVDAENMSMEAVNK